MTPNTIDTVLLLGRPGSGKGTQTKLLAAARSWKSLSSGDTIKALRDGTDALALRVRACYDAGQLLPDWLPMYIFEDTLIKLSEGEGIICEGFGRTRAQAELIENILTWLGRGFVVINLEVSEEEAMRRMIERSKTEDRPDSNGEAKIRDRFTEFRKNTEPALEYFKSIDKLITINGEQDLEKVAEDIKKALENA
jgi:adenylate kinase